MKKIAEVFRHPIEKAQRECHLSAVAAWTIFIAPFVLLGTFIFFMSYPPTQDATAWISESHMERQRWTIQHYPFEYVMAAAFLFGSVVSWRLAFWLKRAGEDRLIWLFYLIFAIGLLWTAGEVTAWGQKFLDYKSPEWFRAHNAQESVTLHNLYGWQNRNHWLRFAFAIGGFAGIALGVTERFRKIAAPAILLSWFLAIAIKCGLDFWTKSYGLNDHGPEFWTKLFDSDSVWEWNMFQWIINRTSKMAKLMVALSAVLYVWLNSRRLRGAGSNNAKPAGDAQ